MEIKKIYNGYNYNDLQNIVNSIIEHNNLLYACSTIFKSYKKYLFEYGFFNNENYFYDKIQNNIHFILLQLNNFDDNFNDKTYYIYILNGCTDDIIGMYAFTTYCDDFVYKTYEHVNDFDRWLYCDLMLLCENNKK